MPHFLTDASSAAVDRSKPVYPTGNVYATVDGVLVEVMVEMKPDWPYPVQVFRYVSPSRLTRVRDDRPTHQ